MNIPSAYFGGRTNINSDSRRSLIRVRHQSKEKPKPKQISTSIKQQVNLTKMIIYKNNEF